jgi:hypothetical protein
MRKPGTTLKNAVPLILAVAAGMGLAGAPPAFGTASTQVWNPSTDVQKSGTVHLGMDNYFSLFRNGERPYQILPDAGVTVGVAKYFEVGIDMVQPSPDPFSFNFKAALPESGSRPALAAGGLSVGTRRGVTDYNLFYGAAAKTLGRLGRVTIGAYRGLNGALFPDGRGGESASGAIASWDKSLSDRIWACVDYASGRSWYGCLSFGASYALGPDVSVVAGFVVFNNRRVVPNDAFTVQFDINL